MNEFTTNYRGGELRLRVDDSQPGDRSFFFSVFFDEGQRHEYLTDFCAHFFDSEREDFGDFDSESEALGEMFFQMYMNEDVARPLFPFGIGLLCEDSFLAPGYNPDRSGDPDECRLKDIAKIQDPEFLDALAKLVFEFLRDLGAETLSPYTMLYFVYFGYTGEEYEFAEQDKKLLDSFQQSKRYGSFFCRHSATTIGDDCYFSIAAQTADPSKFAEYYPEGKPECDLIPEIIAEDDEDLDSP